MARIHALSERYPRLGDRKLYTLLKVEQWPMSRETLRCIRKREGLQSGKDNTRGARAGRNSARRSARHPNHVWSYDFGHGETTDGRRLECLTILDE